MDRIGKYKVIKELGAGGFGAVYLAEDEKFSEKVAIKVFKIRDEGLAQQATSATSDAGEVMRKRFLTEAKVLRQLSTNPNIIDVFDFDELEDGTPYYVMPYLGQSLRQRLGSDSTDVSVLAELDADDKPKSLPVNQALLYLEQLLIALKDVHKAKLVHRDIKPANVLLNEHQQVKLCDFGIAKAPDVEVSHSGVGMGSRNYMSPEQRQSAKHVDPRSDIYSVGVLAYRMITGTLPEGRFQDPITYQPNLNLSTNAIIVKALEQRKEDRYSNAGDMLKALKSAIQTSNALGQGSYIEDEHTGTWIEEGSTSIKAELKPLEQKIVALLQSQGEVKNSDMPVLQAFADLGGLGNDELTILIEQIKHQQANKNPKQKAFQQWLAKISQRASEKRKPNEQERSVLIEAAMASTDHNKTTLANIIDQKFSQSLARKKTKPQKKPLTIAEIESKRVFNRFLRIRVLFIFILTSPIIYSWLYHVSFENDYLTIKAAYKTFELIGGSVAALFLECIRLIPFLIVVLLAKFFKTQRSRTVLWWDVLVVTLIHFALLSYLFFGEEGVDRRGLVNDMAVIYLSLALLSSIVLVIASLIGFVITSKLKYEQPSSNKYNRLFITSKRLKIFLALALSLFGAMTYVEHTDIKEERVMAMEDLISSMRNIRPGVVTMDCRNTDIECSIEGQTKYEVNVKAFKMMDKEVTNAMWEACVLARECEYLKLASGLKNTKITRASYDDIVNNFIPWLNKLSGSAFRLPSEVEWEYAARQGGYYFRKNELKESYRSKYESSDVKFYKGFRLAQD